MIRVQLKHGLEITVPKQWLDRAKTVWNSVEDCDRAELDTVFVNVELVEFLAYLRVSTTPMSEDDELIGLKAADSCVKRKRLTS